MKTILLFVVLALLAGCEYEVPLSQKPSSKANPALAGRWIEQKDSNSTNRIEIEIKVSGNDYDVAYVENSCTNFLFSGFEVKAAGFKLVQLTWQNPDKENPKTRYVFMKYELTPEGFFFRQINTAVVSAKCRTTEELLGDLKLHRKNPSLFKDPRKFVRSASQ